MLLEKVASDRYPSATVMDMFESVLRPDEVSASAGVVMDKIQTDKYPSTSLIGRLLAVTS